MEVVTHPNMGLGHLLDILAHLVLKNSIAKSLVKSFGLKNLKGRPLGTEIKIVRVTIVQKIFQLIWHMSWYYQGPFWVGELHTPFFWYMPRRSRVGSRERLFLEK